MKLSTARAAIRRQLPFLKRLRPATLNLLFNRAFLIVITVLIVTASLVAVWRIKARTQHELDEERARQAQLNLIPFEKRARPAITSREISLWQSYQNTRALARFKDSYFAATDGGLVELHSSGRILRIYTVLDGLPESDLLSLASFNTKLFIGTRSQGLISFDGEGFESYRWLDRSAQSIDALLVDGGRLLVGTRVGGLIEFDGRQFKEITVGADTRRLPAIIHLSKIGSRLFAGTFADGLWVEEGARWSHFTVADGLPSNRVVAVAAMGRDLFVAADYGLAAAPIEGLSAEPTPARTQSASKQFRPIAVVPSLSGMAQLGENILLCKDDGETFALRPAPRSSLSSDRDETHGPQLVPLGQQSKPGSGCRLLVVEEQLWVLSNEGIRRLDSDPAGNRDVASAPAMIAGSQSGAGMKVERARQAGALTNNLISALAVDSRGWLWAGGFRTGIDVLDAEGKKVTHLESDAGREINSLSEDRKTKTMLAATAQGVLRFDANLRATQRWSTADGLLSNSVMHLAQPHGDLGAENERDSIYLACATGKGLTLGVPGKFRSLTTVQGLPSNSLYAVLSQGRSLYAGTLSGLALIQDGRVVRVFKDSNSNLTTNWVTALCVSGSRLFVGTYGGGVFELTPSGELLPLTAGSGRAVVNPNAMWSDGERLYVGTLDGALMFDLYSQKWTPIVAELPSRTVLSITGDERYVYFGTTSGIARIERRYWDRLDRN